MIAPLETPDDARLTELGLVATTLDEDWVRCLTFESTRGDAVALTWDEVGASVTVVWTVDGRVLLELTREAVVSLSVDAWQTGHVVTITSRSDGLHGRLSLTVADDVHVRDTILRA